MSSEGSSTVIISDDDEVDFQSSKRMKPSSSPSLLNNFYNKYVFKPDSSENSTTNFLPKKKFDFDTYADHSKNETQQSSSDGMKSSTFNSPIKSSNKKSNEQQDGKGYQDFEFPKIATNEAKPSEPIVVATRCISGVSVQLPVIPYPAQLSVMDKVIKGITHRENCLIESPTGSGKTLALLCSSLAWQKQERERIEKLIAEEMKMDMERSAGLNDPLLLGSPENLKTAESNVLLNNFQAPSGGSTKNLANQTKGKSKKAVYIDEDEDDLFVQKPVKANTIGSPEKSDKDVTDKGDLVTIHPTSKFPELTNDEKKSSCADSCNSPSKSCGNQASEEHIKIPKVPRIIFGTRTHKQIEQVIKELKRTTYAKNLRMSILSSREHTCVRTIPKEYSSKTKFCKAIMDKAKLEARLNKMKTGSGCQYYDNKVALTGSRAPNGVWDIEDLVEMGYKRRACPYFAARDLADFAHIVFCPYNYIIDPIIRSSIQMSLEDNIILVDEGHNIEDVCRDTASLVIDNISIQDCIKDLEESIKMRPLSEEDDNAMFFYFKKYFQNWSDLFQNHIPLLQKQTNVESSFILDGKDLADALQRHSIGYNQFMDLKVRVNVALAESRNVKPEDVTKRMIPLSAGTLLESIVVIFEYYFKNECQHLDNYNGIFTKKNEWIKGKPESRMTLKISCMDPSLVFSEISSKARCIVLSSGTLTPIFSFSSELGTPFHHTLQARHVIKPDQVWVGTIDSGPNGVPLEATYKNTSSTEWQDSLGQIILWVSQKVPNGVLCFLSSYRLIEVLQERWESTGLWQKLQEYKYVFTESKSMSEHDQIMGDFYSSVVEGAILFAVFRGKVSEGMDFRDHQARAVITVGIPYANVKDPMVDGKMKYNNSHQSDKNLVSGRDWYSIQAFRALNQALGRCVRHKNDWGAIIMVDSRFRRDHFKQHISKWVQTFLANQHHDWSSFTGGFNNLEKFISNMKSQPDTIL